MRVEERKEATPRKRRDTMFLESGNEEQVHQDKVEARETQGMPAREGPQMRAEEPQAREDERIETSDSE